MTRPRAARTTPRTYTGEQAYNGIVIASDLMTLNFDGEVMIDGKKTRQAQGEVRIVKLTYQTGGLKYEVQIDGHPIFDGPAISRFATLFEAAEYACL